jgi:hypothetical protein
MLVRTFEQGNDLFVVGVFKGDQLRRIDPATVTFKVSRPISGLTSYIYGVGLEITRLVVGIYRITVDLNEEGTWTYRWEASGDYSAATEGTFEVTEASL